MANLKLRMLPNFKIVAGVIISAAVVPAICAQASRQLQVEVGANQQVTILASNVSYGDVLRALQRKLGWEIEIPPLADEVNLSYVRVETTQPQIALAKLLEGSRLGYAFRAGVSGSSSKVVVVASTPRDTKTASNAESRSGIPETADTGVSVPRSAQTREATMSMPNVTVQTMPEQPVGLSTMPLSEAIEVIGVPLGTSPADVGKTLTFQISDAARIMGVPPGMSSADVGKTISLPLTTEPRKHP
jgi:hypothetical protein